MTNENKILRHFVKDRLTNQVFDIDILNFQELMDLQNGCFNEQEFQMISNKIDDIIRTASKKSDEIKGGKSDKITIEEIAKKHDVSVEYLKKQIEIGKKIEMEHVNNSKLAEEISMDHLVEFPDYYTRLKKMETEANKAKKTKKANRKYVLTKEAWREIGETAGWIKKAQFKENMMPGQDPYSKEELDKLHGLVGDAAKGDPGELDEMEYYEREKGDRGRVPILPGYYVIKTHQKWGWCPTYRNENDKDDVLYYDQGKFLKWPELKKNLRDTWRPASREDQDWFVTNLGEKTAQSDPRFPWIKDKPKKPGTVCPKCGTRMLKHHDPEKSKKGYKNCPQCNTTYSPEGTKFEGSWAWEQQQKKEQQKKAQSEKFQDDPQFIVVDNAFNRENYPDIVGQKFHNPPAYAQVQKIKDNKPSLKDIFHFQSKLFSEEDAQTMLEDFIAKALKVGYNKDEIVEGLAEFYRQHPSSGTGIFDRYMARRKN